MRIQMLQPVAQHHPIHSRAVGARALLAQIPDQFGIKAGFCYPKGFRIDLSQPARFDTRGRLVAPEAQRITGLTWRGAPLNPAHSFIVATNAYRSNGGSGFAGTERGNLVLDDGTPVRDVVAAHLRARGTALPPAASGWGFVPMPGTSVTFLSSPAARDTARPVGGLT